MYHICVLQFNVFVFCVLSSHSRFCLVFCFASENWEHFLFLLLLFSKHKSNLLNSQFFNPFTNAKVGDRILAVNEHDVRKATQEQAINLIKNAGCTIKLDIQSFDLSVN